MDLAMNLNGKIINMTKKKIKFIHFFVCSITRSEIPILICVNEVHYVILACVQTEIRRETSLDGSLNVYPAIDF